MRAARLRIEIGDDGPIDVAAAALSVRLWFGAYSEKYAPMPPLRSQAVVFDPRPMIGVRAAPCVR